MTFQHFNFEYIDIHTHFFPPQLFKAIWDYFEFEDKNGNVLGWSVKYKLSTKELVQFLESQKVKYFTTYNYAHKPGVADFINEWTNEFVKIYTNAIPFGCVWPGDEDRVEYIKKILDEYEFNGIKIQPLVQNFYPADPRMEKIYDLVVDRNKWICFHAGTAPQRNKYVGYKNFLKFIEKYPNVNVIVAHMGAFEYRKFFELLDKYENLYLDTTMIFIPENVFPERKHRQPTSNDLLSYQDRILYGSDFPNIPYDYQMSTRGLLDFDFPKSFYENIFYNNAKRLFKIK